MCLCFVRGVLGAVSNCISVILTMFLGVVTRANQFYESNQKILYLRQRHSFVFCWIPTSDQFCYSIFIGCGFLVHLLLYLTFVENVVREFDKKYTGFDVFSRVDLRFQNMLVKTVEKKCAEILPIKRDLPSMDCFND